jgi:hypothetical protein
VATYNWKDLFSMVFRWRDSGESWQSAFWLVGLETGINADRIRARMAECPECKNEAMNRYGEFFGG